MIEDNLIKLEQWFLQRKKTITAFSGGIDSTLVLYLSKRFLGENGVGCISISPSLKRKDYAFAVEFCEVHDILLEVIETQELLDENYYNNPSNRCYFCKNHLYMSLQKLQPKYPDAVLINGVNTNDLGDYRPGLKAADEHEVQSPLVECDMDKAMVRELAQHLGLPNWSKPASPCLSSRIPYGSAVTLDKLAKIEKAEQLINDMGFEDVRVRHYEEEARIEVPKENLERIVELFPEISEKVKSLGFKSCVLDTEGLVSGKLNRVLLNNE